MTSKVPAGKKALIINLDETAVCLLQSIKRGTVIVGKKRKRDSPVQQVSRASRRTYLTHVALICDNPFYQKYLPQVVIGNEHTLLGRDLPTWRSLSVHVRQTALRRHIHPEHLTVMLGLWYGRTEQSLSPQGPMAQSDLAMLFFESGLGHPGSNQTATNIQKSSFTDALVM